MSGHRPDRAWCGDPARPEEGEPVTHTAVGRLADRQGEPPSFVQLLTPEGTRVERPDYTVDLRADELRSLYRDLVLVRRFDAEGTALQRQGELGLWASLLGQEAAQIGSARALAPQDYAFPTYREHGVAWCRNVDPLAVFSLYRGITQGGWDPAVHNFQLYTIVVGAQALHATGYAMGIQRDGAVGTGDPSRDAAAVAYFGDGAMSQGDVNEAMVFAGVFNAPVVFFCQNNQWAISEPNSRQTRIPLYQRASGFGIPGVQVDGNDVLAVYAVTKAALDRAHGGEGPTLIEAYTYRIGAHTTSDDPSRYRIADEVEMWKRKDPIARFRTYLTRSGLADDAFFAALDQESDELAAHLRSGCLSLVEPEPVQMFDHVYHEPHEPLAQERAAFEAYQRSFTGADGATS
jgi:2-oxoisovalerate dehydrogenase E1 component alpha subunit